MLPGLAIVGDCGDGATVCGRDTPDKAPREDRLPRRRNLLARFVRRHMKTINRRCWLFVFLIVLSMQSAAQEWAGCVYWKADGTDATRDDCLQPVKRHVSGWDALIVADVMANADYGRGGVAFLISEAGAYYFKRGGPTRRTLIYDNGPDTFSEGLARTIRDGKVGYFDRDLNIVVARVHDFGLPFQNGKALVCRGCTFESHGEHTAIVGGKWGAIDRRGTTVVPLLHSRARAEQLLKRGEGLLLRDGDK